MVSLYRNEVQQIELKLDDRLKIITENDIHGRFQVHKLAFDEVMSIVKVYQPLLRDIKLEYESLVNHVISAQKYSEKMEDEIKTASSYPTTIENHERYRNELREKLQCVRRSNNHRLEKIRDVQMKCDAISKTMNKDDNATKDVKVNCRRDLRRLPNMSLTELTDLPTMQSMSSQLEIQVNQLKHTQTTKYVKKDEEIELSNQLLSQISKHDELRVSVKNLIQQKVLLQTALQQVRTFDECHDMHQNIGELIVRALVNDSRVMAQMDAGSEDISIEEIDNFFPESKLSIGSTKENDYIVFCVQSFEKLFNEGKYQEAADLAVVAPRGVLRNYTVLQKFKNLMDPHNVLYYCQQLVKTMTNRQLDADMSYECVDSCLKVGRIDLVILWVSQGRIQSTELIADNLTSHADLMPDNKIACLDLATSIYWELMSSLSNQNTSDDTKTIQHQNPQWLAARGKYFDSILECQIKSGRIEEVIDLLTNENSTPVSARSREQMYKTEDLLLLIQFYPNIELVQSLIEKQLMSFALAMKSLLETGSYGVAAELMIKNSTSIDITEMTQQLIDSIPAGISTEAWEEMLNFVNESDEKIIIEAAASYLVQISIEKSYMALKEFGRME